VADSVDVRDNPAASRFEILVDGTVVGFAEYRDTPGHRTFTHTEVDPAMEGHGLAGRLVRHALDDTRARGLASFRSAPSSGPSSSRTRTTSTSCRRSPVRAST
jgi:predicted GNAT family acetyltransferase